MSVKKDLEKAHGILVVAAKAKDLADAQKGAKEALDAVDKALKYYELKKKSVPKLLDKAWWALEKFRTFIEFDAGKLGSADAVFREARKHVVTVIKATHLAEKELKAS